jgi:hypothetical protein
MHKPFWAQILFLFLSTLLLSGCFTREVTVQLKKDGSGTIRIRTEITPAMIQYLKGATQSDTFDRGFNEAALNLAAEQYGRDITYQSHQVDKKNDTWIYTVTYTFENLTTVKLALDTRLPFIGPIEHSGTPRNKTHPVPSFPAFTFHNRGNGQFTIYPPKTPKPMDIESLTTRESQVSSKAAIRQREAHFAKEIKQWMQFGNPYQLTGNEDQIGLIRALSKDMKFRLEIVTETPILSTTSPYKLGDNTLLLFAIQVDELLQDERIAKEIEANGHQTLLWNEIAHSEKTVVDTGKFRLLNL